MNLYVREMVSKLEILEIKDILKKIKFIKKICLKKWIKNIIRIIIVLKYEFFYYTGQIIINTKKDYIECLIPLKEKENKRIVNNWIKHLNNILNNKKIKSIIFSKKLKKIDMLRLTLGQNNGIEGKNMLKIMIEDVIEYICNKKKERIENQTVYVLVNNYSKENLEFLENLALKVKSLNIVTKNLNKFLYFTNRLYEKKEVITTVSNNKRKALSKAKILINIDFLEDTISKYNINRSCIFINLVKDNICNIKGFSGIFVNGLNIKENRKIRIIELNKSNLFNNTALYESVINNGYNLKEANERIKKDNVEINYLIGKNGKIDENEYSKIA